MNQTKNRLAKYGYLLALAALAGSTGCSKPGAEAPKSKGGGAVPVLAGDVVKKDMPVLVRAIGSVQSPVTVTVKPQVGGIISEIHFKEGQNVKRGDLLFSIDNRPFLVAKAQAEASLAQAKALAGEAEDLSLRYAPLDKTGAVSKDKMAQIAFAEKAANAAVQAAEAAVKNAGLQLDYATVRAPVSGRTGRFLVDAGNVVRANETDLLVINQIAPIEVRFAVPQQYLSETARFMAQGPLKVVATSGSGDQESADGELTFVDNAVKSTSGTVDYCATFPNKETNLWPGQFVNVALRLRVDRDVVVAPARAVQIGQQGSYVFVISPASTAENRPVVVDRIIQDQAVIASGIKEGDRVVIDGQSRISQGAKVDIKKSIDESAVPPVAPAKKDAKGRQ